MLSDDEITDMWASASSTEADEMDLYAFARAVERAAYERAVQECEARATAPQGEDYLACYYACADAIRALGEQHD
jgi:hypothetical protein